MSTSLDITSEDAQKLKHFHEAHFPQIAVPPVHFSHDLQEKDANVPDSPGLGFYEDGTRRALTDDQIAMFRHSEIQRYLKARRQQQAAAQEEEVPQAQRRPRNTNHEGQPGRLLKPGAAMLSKSSSDVKELSYDEDATQQKERMFLWPTLG